MNGATTVIERDDAPTTVIDARELRPSRPVPPPRRVGGLTPSDVWIAIGSAASAIAIAFLLGPVLLLVHSLPQLVFLGWLAFVLVWGIAANSLEGGEVARDRMMSVVVASATICAAVPLLSIIWLVVRKGIGTLRPHFFFETQQFVGPTSSALVGGAGHAIVGTLEQVGIAVVISVPLGFVCAVFLTEVGGPVARLVRVFVDAMSGVPTIVAGLFVYAAWVIHFGFSGLAAAFAISISMLPVVARTAEEVLRLVPSGLREASLALGAPEWRTTGSVVLPTARTGLVTAIILGVARAIGETAPLIMTAFGAAVMNTNPFEGAQAALPLYIYRQITESSNDNVQARAWMGALVLLVLVLTLFTLARILSARAGRPRSSGRRRGPFRRRRKASAA